MLPKSPITKDKTISWGPIESYIFGLMAFVLPQILAAFFLGVYGGVTETDLEGLIDNNEAVITLIFSLVSVVVGTWILIAASTKRNKKNELKDEAIKNATINIRDTKIWKRLGFNKVKSIDLVMVLPVFFVYFVALVLANLAIEQFAPVVDLDQAQDTGFNNNGFSDLLMGFGALVILAPVYEEILFRGFMFRGLAKRYGFWLSSLSISVLFGIAHFQLNVGVDTFLLGMAASYLVWKTNSIWPAIMLHGIKNALAFTLVFILEVT